MVVTRVLARLRADRAGQTMAEYAVVLAVIGVGVLAMIAGFSGAATGAITRATELLP
jgi:Flp pilus assembly pilin Flp